MQTIATENKKSTSQKIHSPYVVPFLFCIVYGVFSDYLFLCAVAGISLAIIIRELWRPLFPPILLYFFILHWAQVFTVIPYLEFLENGTDLNGEYVDISLKTNASQVLVGITLMQVAVMATVVGFFVKRISLINTFSIKRASTNLQTSKVLIGYFISMIIIPTLGIIAAGNPSAMQLLNSADVFRKVFLVLLVFILFTKKDKLNGVIIGILVFEFIMSFTGFFSEFKDIILFVLIVYFTIHSKLKASVIFKALPAVVILGFILIFWSYVKPGYRDFVSGGTNQQVVYASKEDAFGYLWKELESFDAQSFKNGTEILLERIETMTLYLKVQERVPDIIPHSNGDNVLNTIAFLTLPRSLNPNKEILDPSTKSTEYTGIEFANAEQGTSIAMGYFVDFYIDFGLYGMIIALILVAAFLGWYSKYLIELIKLNLLFKFSLLIGFIFSLGSFESDITFFFGAFRNLLIIYFLGVKFIFPFVNNLIQKPGV